MWIIKIYTDDWHDVQNDTLKVIDPVLKERLNSCGSLEYKVSIDDVFYDKYERLKTRVIVLENNIVQFAGRLLETSKDFYNTMTLIFEGDMAMLNDVQYRPYEFKGPISELFVNVLNYYNSRCSLENRIEKGRVTVTDANNYIARSDTNYSSCWQVLSKKLVELCGGYLKIRYVWNDNTLSRYLDYLENPGTESTQKIEFGENILNIDQELNGQDIVTVLIPFGAEDESTGERIDITSVNPTGLNYIVSPNYQKFGLIEHVQFWDDVTLPQNLYNKAVNFLKEHDTSGTTIKVTAIDLHAVDVEIQKFNCGDTVKVISKPHDIDTYMLINERDRNLNDVSKDSITLGNQLKTFTSNVDSNGMKAEVEIDEQVKQEITQKVIVAVEDIIPSHDDIVSISSQQTKLLLGSEGGFFEVLYDVETNRTAGFRIMDSSNPEEAVNVWLFTNNGFGFSNTGVNGPYYNAWTIDGHLSADSLYTGVLASRDGSFSLDLDSGELKVEGIEKRFEGVDDAINENKDAISEVNDTAQEIKSDYLSKNDSDYKKITTSVKVNNDGVIISGSTNGSDNPTSLKINSGGVFIQDKMNNVITSMTTNEFRTGKWVLQQTNDNKTFNIFKER